MSVMAEWVFKPLPGQTPASVAEYAKAAMALWAEQGGRMRLWYELWGEYGCMRVTGEFASFEAYGKAHDAVSADPRMQQWGTQNAASGTSEWMRAAVLRELPV